MKCIDSNIHVVCDVRYVLMREFPNVKGQGESKPDDDLQSPQTIATVMLLMNVQTCTHGCVCACLHICIPVVWCVRVRV